MTIPQLVPTLSHQTAYFKHYVRDRTLYAMSVNLTAGEHHLYNPDGDLLDVQLPPHLLMVALHTGDYKLGPFDTTTPNPEAWATVYFYRLDTEPHWG